MAKASVVLEITGDEKRIVRALARSEREVDKLKKSLRESGREGQKAGKKTEDAFGNKAQRSLASYAAGMISITAVIGTAKRALTEFFQVAQQAAQRQREILDLKQNLIQISGGSEARFAQFMGTSQALIGQGLTQRQALSAVFQGTSLGRTQEQIVAAGRFKKFAADPSILIESAAGLQRAFGKQTLGGSEASIVNALLAGAEQSKVNVTDLARAALFPAQSIKKLGGTGREALAAVAVAAPALPSVEQASTSVSRLADVLARNRKFKGKGLLPALEVLSGMTERQLVKTIGSNIRADKGVRVLLENLPAFKTTLTSIDEAIGATGTAESRITKAVGLGAKVIGPELAAISARQTLLSREQQVLGGPQQRRERMRSDLFTALTEQGAGAFRRLFTGMDIGLAEVFLEDPDVFGRRAQRLARPGGVRELFLPGPSSIDVGFVPAGGSIGGGGRFRAGAGGGASFDDESAIVTVLKEISGKMGGGGEALVPAGEDR